MAEENPETSAIEKLIKLLDDEKPEMFTEAEVNALKNFARVLLALETLGTVGALARRIIIWLGVMITAFIAFKNGFLEWVSTNIVR